MRRLRIMLMAILLLLMIIPAIPAAQAKTTDCDLMLWFYGIGTAFQDPSHPGVPPIPAYWQWGETPYTVDYWFDSGITGFVQTLQVKRQNRVVGLAINGQWRICDKSEDWKHWLTKK